MPRRSRRTPKGHAVRHNAVTHGPRTADIIVPGELRQHWRRFHDAVVAELAPETPVETELASHAAAIMWRLRRLARAEASIMRAPDADFIYTAARAIRSITAQINAVDEFDDRGDPAGASYAGDDPGGPEHASTPASNLIAPKDRALDRIVRYESHLYRQLYAALERLAVLQARRRRAESAEYEAE